MLVLMFTGGFVATERVINFKIVLVLSRRSDVFHTLRQMSLVRSILAEDQLYSTPLEPPSVGTI